MGDIVTSWAYAAPPFAEKFVVSGERGSLWSDGTTLHHRTGTADPVVTKFATVDVTVAEIADFAACVRERRHPIHSVAEGTHVLEIILAAYRSAEQGRTVALADLEQVPA